MSTAPIRVNRAPVLTLWAAVVAERLGHAPDTALSLASAVAGTAARAKARRLGLAEEHEAAAPKEGRPAPRRTVRLLGREIPLAEGPEGPLAAEPDGRPAKPGAVRAYVARAFGERLPEVRAAMEDLAARFEPEELNRIGFRLYEAFRPEVPPDVSGWGARAALHLERIRAAAD
ncbi:hypothetical protein [Paracraurococcus lichenis]|uniref:Uncharacterized protein n=1 Tax=Paracraurococcus lichenis TaxID=3064888 RepID=A0ABT9E8B6_9PROT|nr:hypothetical protein [Paracraurococcus sp. LOR1-02]MDO9712419.1 hypothetical protein [Paracraurococcus sp. LOR1-02]